MYPNAYIEDGFTKEFDHYVETLPSTTFYSSLESRAKHNSLRRIYDFLMSANIYSDFSEEDVKNSFTAETGFSETLKEQIIRSTYKNDTYTELDRRLIVDSKRELMLSCEYCFFTGDSFQDAFDSSRQLGRIILGKEFLKSQFFLNHSFPSVSTDSTLYQIKDVFHPCSSLVIIDKHLFKDSKDLDPKLPNLIQAIDWLRPKGLSEKFEVSIITENTKSNLTHVISRNFNAILRHFENKIALRIYAPCNLKEVEASDRFILTNYALISIPHPFDRPTTISCNFYPSHQEDFCSDPLNEKQGNTVRKGYSTWESKIALAKSVVGRTPEKIVAVQYVWKVKDEPEHKIFDVK